MLNQTMLGPAVHIRAEDAAQILMEGAQELFDADHLIQLAPSWKPGNSEWKNGGARSLLLNGTGGLLNHLETAYGPRGGQGLALRIGRAAFRCGMKRLGDAAGFGSTEFRLLPAPRRMERGLHVLASALSELTGDEITVRAEKNGWLWRMIPRVPKTAPHLESSCCLIVGLLQGFMSWAGGGRFYTVRETECRANGGPACVFFIDSRPVD